MGTQPYNPHNPHGVNKRCHGCDRYFSGELEGNYLCLECSLRAAEIPRARGAKRGCTTGDATPAGAGTSAQRDHAA